MSSGNTQLPRAEFSGRGRSLALLTGGLPRSGRGFLIGERVSEQRPHVAFEGQLRGVTLPTLAAAPGQRAKVTAMRAGQEMLPTSRCPRVFSSVILSPEHSSHTSNREIKSGS